MQAAPDAACMPVLGSSRSCNNYKVDLEQVGARPERPPIYVADVSSQYELTGTCRVQLGLLFQLKNINLFCLPSLSYGYKWC